jgi:hypothetical protein
LSAFWDNVQVGGSFVGVVLAIWIALRTLGMFDRPAFTVRSTWLSPTDPMLGTTTIPHFVVQYDNHGNAPVTFSDFEILLPRLKGVVGKDGSFVLHLGAELFIDKRPSSRVWGIQHLKGLDYRTNKVPLRPGASHTDFFDLGAFVEVNDAFGGDQVRIPDDFEPVLQFRDSYGHWFHCDASGAHLGEYAYPHQRDLEAAGLRVQPASVVKSKRRPIRWLGWSQTETKALTRGEVRPAS